MQDSAMDRAGLAQAPAGSSGAGRAGDLALRQIVAAGAARRATVQDQIDSADAAFAAGYIDAARLISALALIRQGFAGPRTPTRRAFAERAGLWVGSGGDALPPEANETHGVEVAVRELRELIALEPQLSPLDARQEVPPPDLEAELTPAPQAIPHGRDIDVQQVSHLVCGLHDALATCDIAALSALLDRVRSAVIGQPALDIADFAAEPLTELAAAGVLNQLRDFFRAHHHLCWPPFGAPVLLASCARLSNGALGAYFTGVGRLIRKVRDLSGLIELAANGAHGDRREIEERWIMLLSGGLDADDRLLVIDQLGDHGLGIALEGMLYSLRHGYELDEPMLVAIRDAALDLGKPALAASAQTAMVRLSPQEPSEWILLADILGTSGDEERSAWVIGQARMMTPNDPAVVERLTASATEELSRFNVIAGIESPPWRVALRARHRAPA